MPRTAYLSTLILAFAYLVACQFVGPPSDAAEAKEFSELLASDEIRPICKPTGRVKIDERRLLAFEMDCVDHKDSELKMLGVAKRFPEMEGGWHLGPFKNAAFLPLGGDLVVYIDHRGADEFHTLESRSTGGEWKYSIAKLYPGPLELE